MKSPDRPLLLLLRTLDIGGAERQAVELASALRRGGRSVTVAVFQSGGALEPILRAADVPLINIGRGRAGLVGVAWRAAGLARQLRPRAVIAYLDGPNLVSLVMKHV